MTLNFACFFFLQVFFSFIFFLQAVITVQGENVIDVMCCCELQARKILLKVALGLNLLGIFRFSILFIFGLYREIIYNMRKRLCILRASLKHSCCNIIISCVNSRQIC